MFGGPKKQTEKDVVAVIEAYKMTNSLEKRKSHMKTKDASGNKIDSKDYAPVIALSFDANLSLANKRLLFEASSPFAKVSSYIHGKLKKEQKIVDESQAITCFVNGKHMPSSDTLLSNIKKEYADAEDGNIYIVYCPQVAFGA